MTIKESERIPVPSSESTLIDFPVTTTRVLVNVDNTDMGKVFLARILSLITEERTNKDSDAISYVSVEQSR